MNDCIFCRVLAGESPASMVYRDERCAAFMDVQPVNPGHVLVVPVRHAAGLADLEAGDAGHLMEVGRAVAAALRASGLRCEGVNLFLADGEAAMQEVFHVHLHVLPRFVGDGFGLRFGPHYREPTPRAALDDAAARVRAALGAADTGGPVDARAVVDEGAAPRARQEIDHLGRELAAAHAGDPWHGPSRVAVLANVGAADAARRPAGGAHSIWELVLHMTAWTSEVARRLRGGAPAEPAAGDWPAAPTGAEVTADAWNAARAALDAAHAELLTALRQLPAERLEAVVGEGRDAPLGTGVSYGTMMRGLLQHDAYHSGQIAILQRVLRQPEASGGGGGR